AARPAPPPPRGGRAELSSDRNGDVGDLPFDLPVDRRIALATANRKPLDGRIGSLAGGAVPVRQPAVANHDIADGDHAGGGRLWRRRARRRRRRRGELPLPAP